jgi:hypothetical protein
VNGPYNNTINYTTTLNATASFTFQGPGSFTFYYTKGNRGTFEIWVDGAWVITINPYSTTKTWQNVYNSSYYSGTGTHTVVIKNVNTGGLQVDIDAIKINP